MGRHASIHGDVLNEGDDHQIGAGGQDHRHHLTIVDGSPQHLTGCKLLKLIGPQHLAGLLHIIGGIRLHYKEGADHRDHAEHNRQNTKCLGQSKFLQHLIDHRRQHHHRCTKEKHRDARDQAVLIRKPFLKGIEHRTIGKAAAQARANRIGQIQHPWIAVADVGCQVDSYRKHQAANQRNDPGVNFGLHQTTQNIAYHKARNHQRRSHGHIAHRPAMVVHHIGLENGPHVQDAHAEHNKQAADQRPVAFCIYTHQFNTPLIISRTPLRGSSLSRPYDKKRLKKCKTQNVFVVTPFSCYKFFVTSCECSVFHDLFGFLYANCTKAPLSDMDSGVFSN